MVGFMARRLAGFRGQAAQCCVRPLVERQYALHLYGQGKTRALYDKRFFIMRAVVCQEDHRKSKYTSTVDIGVQLC